MSISASGEFDIARSLESVPSGPRYTSDAAPAIPMKRVDDRNVYNIRSHGTARAAVNPALPSMQASRKIVW
jgi:hypothetical protein